MVKREVEGVDFDFLDGIDGLSDAVKQKIMDGSGKRLKEMHGAMTKAQQLGKRHQDAYEKERTSHVRARTKLDKWTQFEQEGTNSEILSNWNKIRERHANGSLYQDRRPVETSEVTASRRTAAENLESLLFQAKKGDISWDDAQPGIASLVEQMKGQSGSIVAIGNEMKGSQAQMVEQINVLRNEMATSKQTTDEQMAGTVNVFLEALSYQRLHPERDANAIVKKMVASGINDFRQAAGQVYGREDLDSVVNERAEKRAEALLEEKISKAQEEGTLSTLGSPEGSEGSSLPSHTFHIRRDEGNEAAPKPARNGVEFHSRIAGEVQKVANRL